MADRERDEEGDIELHARVRLVRELNAAIRVAGGQLDEGGDLLLDFYCECGCWEVVQVTVAEYDGRNARLYRKGHPGQ